MLKSEFLVITAALAVGGYLTWKAAASLPVAARWSAPGVVLTAASAVVTVAATTAFGGALFLTALTALLGP